jgi:hypothetical protein
MEVSQVITKRESVHIIGPNVEAGKVCSKGIAKGIIGYRIDSSRREALLLPKVGGVVGGHIKPSRHPGLVVGWSRLNFPTAGC